MLSITVMLLVTAVSAAELSISPFDKTTYNFGDKILVKGIASAENSTSGTIILNLNCAGDTASNLGVTKVTFTGKNTTFNFPIIVNKEVTGVCRVITSMTYEAESNSSDILSLSAISEEITITKDLNCDLAINQTSIQSGQSIVISGSVKKIDGSLVNGLAKLYFKQEEIIFLRDDAQIINGAFSYKFDSSKSPAGKYSLFVEINDLYGNEVSKDAGSFEVSNNLLVTANLNKEKYVPKENIIINGSVYPELQFYLADADVSFKIDEVSFKTRAIRNSYSYAYPLPKDIKTGEHTLFVSVTDRFGNEGKTAVNFSVIPAPTLLMTELSSKSVIPGASIIMVPYLYDQANDVMENDGLLFVLDPDKKSIFNSTITFGKSVNFDVPNSSSPGDYTVKTISGSIVGEEQFTIQGLESVKLAFVTENKTIIVENNGNVNYGKNVVIKAVDSNGKITEVKKKVDVGPGEKGIIDLSQELDSGVFSLVLPKTYSQEEQLVPDVNVTDKRSVFKKMADGMNAVTGNVVGLNGSFSWIPLLLVLGAIIAVVIVRTVYVRKFSGHYADKDKVEAEDKKETDAGPSPEDKKISAYAKKTDEIAKDYVVVEDPKTASEKKETADADAEKTDDPILRKYYEKKNEKHKSELAGSRDDPQIKRFVSDTLKRALPEAKDEPEEGQKIEELKKEPDLKALESNEETAEVINAGLETKVKDDSKH